MTSGRNRNLTDAEGWITGPGENDETSSRRPHPRPRSHATATFDSYVAFGGGAWQPFTEAGGQRDVFAACESQARADEE